MKTYVAAFQSSCMKKNPLSPTNLLTTDIQVKLQSLLGNA